MANTKNLLDLIKSLSQGEKRHFKLLSQGFKKNSGHIRLFDFLNKQKRGNQRSLVEFEEGFYGNDAALKIRYLKEQILQSLRNYHKDKTVGANIMNLIQDAENFYHKQLFTQCLKSLSRAKKIAKKYERFGLHLEILSWERRLIGSTLEYYKITEKEISEEELLIQEKNNNVLWARKMQSAVFEYKKQYGFRAQGQLSILDQIVSKSSLVSIDEMMSDRAKFYYLWMRTLYHSMLGEYQDSYMVSLQFNEQYQDVVDPEDFFYGLLEHVTSCIYTHRYNEVLSTLKKIKSLAETDKYKDFLAISERLFYYDSNYTLIALASIGDLNALDLKIGQTILELREKKGKIADVMLNVLKSTLGQVLFLKGDYSGAKEFHIEILNTSKSKLRSDLISNSRFNILFILLELGELDLLESEIKSSLNYFSKYKSSSHIELTVLKVIQSFKNLNFKEEKEDLAKEVLKMMHNKFKDNQSEGYFDDLIYVHWSNAILNQSTGSLEAKNWYQHQNRPSN